MKIRTKVFGGLFAPIFAALLCIGCTGTISEPRDLANDSKDMEDTETRVPAIVVGNARPETARGFQVEIKPAGGDMVKDTP